MPLHPLALSLFLVVLAAGDRSSTNGILGAAPIGSAADSTAVLRTAARFHDALKNGDTTAVKNLIASDLRVLEGGEVENRTQYLSHHLAADIEFAKAVNDVRTVVSYTRHGNVAWLISTSTARGKFNGRDIDSVSAELMILSRTEKGWRIRAVHWSSQKRQAR